MLAEHIVAKELYNIDLIDIESAFACDVIILAVAHDNYKMLKKEFWLEKFNTKGIFMDVKSVYSKEYFFKTDIG